MPIDYQLKPEQIIALLKEVEAGETVTAVCRRHGISHGAYYRWRAKYGGMEADEVRRLRELNAENTRLKLLLAEGKLMNDVLLDRVTELVSQTRRKKTSDDST